MRDIDNSPALFEPLRGEWVTDPKGSTAAGQGPQRGRRATKDEREQLPVYLRPEGIKKLKFATVKWDTTASAIMVKALNASFRRHSRPPVAY